MRILIAFLALLLAIRDAAAVSRCPGYSKLKNAYFGDLHEHTSYSLDAYQFGTRTNPASAYAFATGASVDLAHGPAGYAINFTGGRLDFATVTDHSEWLSSDYGCIVDASSPFYASSYCVTLRAGGFPPDNQRPCAGSANLAGTGCLAEQTAAWNVERQATEAANDPCTFTTFHAYEWTLVNVGSVLHKNVYFRNANVPALPLDAANYPTAPLLWAGLAGQCNPGNACEALTIPHNMNQSAGQAFPVDIYAPLELNRMTEFQRLAEIHQHKGNSECLTDTADTGAVSACDFEMLPNATPLHDPGYARPALKEGLARFAAGGHDPLKLGFVGGTDDHDGTPGAVGEVGFVGHLGGFDSNPSRRLSLWGPLNPGGVTGVWAEENTRDALWAALRRRETFATSGPRLKVRFYAFSGPSDPCADADFPDRLVRGGAIPMGGTFHSVPGNGTPRFVVYAVPDQAALAAVDLVKGSVTNGVKNEQVFTIPLTGPPYCVTWTDTGFDAAAPAFYYARVREQPTWRWSHYDCAALRTSNPSDWQTIAPGCASSDPTTGGLDYMIQERAWTSSIWHLPGAAIGVSSAYLRMRDGSLAGDPERRSFSFRATTKAAPGVPPRILVPPRTSPGDPTIYGARLTIQNPVETGETVVIPLPAAGWEFTGTRYTFAASSASPVQSVAVATDRISVGGGGSAWPFTLDEPRQGTLAIRLDLGTGAAWCASAPARQAGRPPSTARHDARDRFNGRPKAPPPDQCPVVGAE